MSQQQSGQANHFQSHNLFIEDNKASSSRSSISSSNFSEDSPLVNGDTIKTIKTMKTIMDKKTDTNANTVLRTAVVCITLVLLALLAVVKGRPPKINGSYNNAPHEDFMPHLPGYNDDRRKPLASDWYSGYLDYELNSNNNYENNDNNDDHSKDGRGRIIHTHYVYVEAPHTINDGDGPDDDTPLIYWTNGGPGASSLFGLLTEHGPLRLNDASRQTESYKKTGVPSLLDNVHTWNNLGSFLVLDAPAPVGYSYCDDHLGGDGFSCGRIPWDDESAAWNNYHALLAFFRKFPHLKRRPLYLTGQSYGGIFIPLLAKRILDHRATAVVGGGVPSSHDTRHGNSAVHYSMENSFHLKGIAMGNPCFGSEVNCGADPPFYNLFFLAGHGQVSLKLYDNILETCGGEQALKSYNPNRNNLFTDECKDLLKQVQVQAGRYFEYNLYDDCPENRKDASDNEDADNRDKDKNKENSRRLSWLRRSTTSTTDKTSNVVFANGVTDYMCGGQTALDEYLSHPTVRRAMHIPDGVVWFDGDDGDGINYKMSEANLSDVYVDLVRGKYAHEGVKVLVYQGDTDPSINSMVAQDFVRNLGLQELESWRPWTLDSCRRVGGHVTRYEGSLDFLTVRGSGHFVPQSKPESALSFLSAWIHDEPFPEFDDSCFNE